MLGVLAVVLCRLLVTCAGVAVGVLDSGACCTVIAVASFVSLRVSLSPPVCPPPASRSRFLPLAVAIVDTRVGLSRPIAMQDKPLGFMTPTTATLLPEF